MKTLLLGFQLLFMSCQGFFLPDDIGHPVVRNVKQVLDENQFVHHEQLDENYELSWNFNDTHILFETHVKTNGYIGFGISYNGAMKGSDVVIGWVKEGKTHFADRHAEGHFLPAVDNSQDWQLISGIESGDFTTLRMVRKLDTCDDQDMPIMDGTTRVIFSYSPNDPADDNSINYHGDSRRGTKSLHLLDPRDTQSDKPLPDDVITVEYLNGNYSVPARDTTYRCTTWRAPQLSGKHHMIRYEPVIQKGHERLLHHMILYYCDAPLDDSQIGLSYNCYAGEQNRIDGGCGHVFTAWGIGGQAFDYPEDVGHSLGTPTDPGYFRLETHYNNPGMRNDFVDNSGFRLYLTATLRQHDAGVIETGFSVNEQHIIPPYEPRFLSSGYCAEECVSEGLGDQEIHVVANLLHSHLLGSKMRLRHFRNGVELPPIQEDQNYDFNFQEMRKLKEERTIKKGDSLTTECYYDSTGRTKATYGGLSTQFEMCLSFILYYPRAPLTNCLMRIVYDTQRYGGGDMFQVSKGLDWKDSKVRADFNKTIDESMMRISCKGDNGHMQSHHQIKDFPKIKSEYKPPQLCPA